MSSFMKLYVIKGPNTTFNCPFWCRGIEIWDLWDTLNQIWDRIWDLWEIWEIYAQWAACYGNKLLLTLQYENDKFSILGYLEIPTELL